MFIYLYIYVYKYTVCAQLLQNNDHRFVQMLKNYAKRLKNSKNQYKIDVNIIGIYNIWDKFVELERFDQQVHAYIHTHIYIHTFTCMMCSLT